MSVQTRRYYVYILASRKYGVLYIGVTSNLVSRIHKHRTKCYQGFTNKYLTYRLVHYEIYGEISMAIQREKNLKKWNRQWKLNLINKTNPPWKDLYYELYG